MKFSLVITTYNRLDLLKRAIASALQQTLPCEIIVVDNASTDGTQDYVKSLGDRVLYHRNPTNTKHAGAVNAGVQIASGDWVKFIDDDDYLADNCLEVMAAAIERHPQAVICSCQAIQVDTDGQEISRTPKTGPGDVFFIPQAAIHYGMLLEQVPFGTPIQVAVQREPFLKAGGWDLSMTSCVEIDAWIRIAEYGDALFINQCLAYRTVWTGGYDQHIDLTRRKAVNFSIKERIYQRIDSQYRDQVPPLTTINSYLNLHWGLVALKQRQWSAGASFCFPAAFSPQAWRLLRQARALRGQLSEPALIPKVPVT
ncbi:MAG: glycosyltransferase family 2 protein [Leptolyngbya sp. SIO1E4]|nr:glycosyltransferase family 2 protein [Leptolyngbya sp. SIO1E4]